MSDTIRLFVGVGANNEDLEAQAVLEHTARTHCSMPLEIAWMQQSAKGPWSGWNSGSWRTPFTGFRWGIPSVCDYRGRAIYTDGDFFFVADLAELWRQPIRRCALVRNHTGKLSTSCILFDCEKAKAYVPSIDELRKMPDAHGRLLNYFREHQGILEPFEGNWDCPDLSGSSLDDPNLKAVHYTRIETQLHLKHAIPRLAAEGRTHWYHGEVRSHWKPELQERFDAELAAAAAAGYTVDRYRVTPFDGATRKDFRYKAHKGQSVQS